MKYNFVIILPLLVLIISCASENRTKVAGSNQLLDARKNEGFTDTIYSNELVFEWSEHLLNSLNDLDGFSKRDTVVNNIHWPLDMDTIRTFRKGESKLGVYIALSKKILMDCDIYDQSIAFSDSIHLGDSKEYICNQLGTQSLRDTLTIIEEDGYGILFQFFFQENKLNRIQYSPVID